MRRLAQPEVLKSAAIGALLTTLLSLPRLLTWTARPLPIWYLEAVLFFGGIVLWAFVFAWHTEYTHRPVLTFKLSLQLFSLATLAGILVGAGLHFFLDPTLRLKKPGEYPENFQEWLAMTLFSLSFTQLFLVFAPFAWLIRLVRNQTAAVILTMLFGIVVLTLSSQSAQTPISPGLVILLALARMGASVWLYLRGGLVLVWWLTLLVDARHLLSLQSHG